MSSPVRQETADLVLVRYGELSLKGGNRRDFESALVRNLKRATEKLSKVRIERLHGRLAVHPEERAGEVAERVRDVFGITSVSPAWSAPNDPEAIVALAQQVLEGALEHRPDSEPIPFRVATVRADKRFPMTSSEFSRFVADRVMPPYEDRLVVRLKGAEVELGIEIRDERTYVFADRLPGPGGLPVGTLGRAVCLLSGGIDSPVAAWLTMKRGCAVSFVSFHSAPYLGESSKQKIVRLVRKLARYQPRNRLYVIPFAEIQEAVRDTAPPSYRTVLYRRMMQRLASRVARKEKAKALVTGESLGQVASQTLENMTCIEDASELPVLRPLVSADKVETIDLARRIGTYTTSVLPEPDCCTVFQPPKPIIRGRVHECEAAESKLDVPALLQRALDGTEVVDV